MKPHTVLAAALFALVVGCSQVDTAQTPVAPPTADKSQSQELSYPQRIRAALLPHIYLTEPIEDNPSAQVKVTIRPDGEVIDTELIKSSGYPSWDSVVLRAVSKAGRIPLDTDGKVPPVLIIDFRPH